MLSYAKNAKKNIWVKRAERANKYLQKTYKTAKMSTTGSRRTFAYLCRRKVSYVSFFKGYSRYIIKKIL